MYTIEPTLDPIRPTAVQAKRQYPTCLYQNVIFIIHKNQLREKYFDYVPEKCEK